MPVPAVAYYLCSTLYITNVVVQGDTPADCTVADLAFVGGVGNEERLLRVLKSNELVPAEMRSNSELLHLEKELTKLRKSTEWANNGLKQVCKRLNCKLSFDDAKYMEILELSILLYNWRNSTCDHQQVKKFFNSLVDDEDDKDNALLVDCLV
jgi:hypothetical protein